MQPDDQWADLAREVPGGFAGVILANGQPALFLRDTTKAARAKEALGPNYVCTTPTLPMQSFARLGAISASLSTRPTGSGSG
jgi:hypothetical protein